MLKNYTIIQRSILLILNCLKLHLGCCTTTTDQILDGLHLKNIQQLTFPSMGFEKAKPIFPLMERQLSFGLFHMVTIDMKYTC